MTDTTQDDLVKRATFALSDMQGRVDASKLQVFGDCIDRIDALTAERDALAEKLDIAIKGLEESREEIDDYIRHEYPGDHPVQERYRKRDLAANPARTTLAAIKEKTDD